MLAQSDQAKKVDDLRIKDLEHLHIRADSLSEVTAFGRETRIDDLAVASADLGLYADQKLTRKIAEVKAGALLQVLQIVDQDVMRVALSSAPNQTGFVKQRPIDPGRVAVKFRVVVDIRRADVRYDNHVVDPILQSSVMADMQVRFPNKDKLLGFGRAQVAAEQLAQLDAIPDRVVRRFVPSLVPDSSLDGDDAVWVVATLLPLHRETRLRFLSSSGISIRPEDAIDLAHLMVEKKSVGTTSEAFSPECTTAIEENQRSMKGRVIAYVQFMLDDQRSDSERIRRVLGAGGFYAPGLEKVYTAPKGNEVRVCTDQNRNAAKQAHELLEKCNMGRFVPRLIPACRKKIPRDTIEIWLGLTDSAG